MLFRTFEINTYFISHRAHVIIFYNTFLHKFIDTCLQELEILLLFVFQERAEKNKLFIYIKIPEVPVRVSYKGSKEKNLEDIRDFSLVIPTLEYHNVTWTWLDLLLAMKTDSRRVILSQAIKQKLQIKSSKGNKEEGSPQEEDKARMLFGTRVVVSSKYLT